MEDLLWKNYVMGVEGMEGQQIHMLQFEESCSKTGPAF